MFEKLFKFIFWFNTAKYHALDTDPEQHEIDGDPKPCPILYKHHKFFFEA